MSYYARFWLTQMCVYRFYIPLLIRLADDVEMNPGSCYRVDLSKTVVLTIIKVTFHCLECALNNG